MAVLRGLPEHRIGSMDRQITIHSLTYTRGAAGESVPATETTDTVWANVQWNTGSEDDESGRLQMDTKVVFNIRYYSGLTNKYWIEYESEVYDIVNIQEVERQRFHKITTERRV